MSRFYDTPDFEHGTAPRTGILLINLGTPDAPTPGALRRYLGQFLRDPRVVELPRPLWWPILHGVILRLRPRRSARAYAKVWTDQGSPLLVYSRALADAVDKRLASQLDAPPVVRLAMRYGRPSVTSELEAMHRRGVRRLLVVPLYPQYSASTTASGFDAVADTLKRWRWVPQLRLLTHYHDFPPYIQALASSIQRHWQDNGRGQKLLFSFHGLPRRYLLKGDPYHCQCHKTARLTAEALKLQPDDWQVTFQSRFGREEWLRPYTDEVISALPGEGVKSVDVVCPGFAADCLETLEEIDMQNREFFMQAGGERFQYIPALNDADEHVEALCELIKPELRGWEPVPQSELNQSAERARKLGASG